MREPIVNKAWNISALQALQAANTIESGGDFARWQQAQLQDFITQGFPNPQHESWKYTNVSTISKQAFLLADNVFTEANVGHLKLADAHVIVFVNGCYSTSVSYLNKLPAQVNVLDLKTALSKKNINEMLKIPDQYRTPFSSLNSALITDGLYLSIPKNICVKHPIHLIHVQTDDRVLMNHPRHLLQVGNNSEVVIFEEYVGQTNAPYFNNIVTQIEAGRNSRIQHFKLQNEAKQAFHISNTIIRQKKDSFVSTTNIETGGCLSRDDLNYELNEEGSQCRLLGLYYLDNERHIDNHSRIDHKVPYCSSEQNYKGVIDGKSRAVFDSRVIVHEGALQTKAHQSNRNLLLSKTAEIDTRPELEIYADDVQCSHGATVGRLDEHALFYLRSRGIDYNMAYHVLTCAFTNEILDQIRHPVIAAKLNQHVVNRLAAKYCRGDCYYGKI